MATSYAPCTAWGDCRVRLKGEDRLFADLGKLGLAWQVFEHQAVFTVEESRSLHDDIAGAHSKNLFLKDTGGQYWLVTVPAEKRVDLKKLPARIGSKRVSFGRADDMVRLIGITPGSVTPLAMVNAVPGEVCFVLDVEFSGGDIINIHPLRNDATLSIAPDDLVGLIENWGHDVMISEIDRQENQ